MKLDRAESERPNTPAPEPVAHKAQRLKLTAAILVLAVAIFIAVQWPKSDSTAAFAASRSADSTEATFVIDYFPAQFDSPAKNNAPEQHIPTF